MAIVHRAELQPSKLDLLAAWLPTQAWFPSGTPVERLSAFRFDDPAGEVGIETFIIGASDSPVHVPLTYRGAPLAGGRLVGEMEHSVLGHRWVYDGPSDPVYVAVVTAAIVDGGADVEMEFDDGTPVPRLDWWGAARGTGADADQVGLPLQVARALPAPVPPDAPALLASWDGVVDPIAVAWLGEPA